ncbi:hypothetical protein HDU97_009647 [Phlyctochytrium planicorne]|nr:hypothetical protein HDU97_009647 [Phlyctochytrium planicorne]
MPWKAFLWNLIASLATLVSGQTTCDGSVTLLDAAFDVYGFDLAPNDPPIVADPCQCAARCIENPRCQLKEANSMNPVEPKAVTIFVTNTFTIRISGSLDAEMSRPIGGVRRELTEQLCVSQCQNEKTAKCQFVVFDNSARRSICRLFAGTEGSTSRIGVKGRGIPIAGGPDPTSSIQVTSLTSVSPASSTSSTFSDAAITSDGSIPTGTQGSVVTLIAGTGTTTVAPTSSSTSDATGNNSNASVDSSSSSSSTNPGLIIGLAVAGSIVGVMILGVLGVYAYRLSRRKQGNNHDGDLFSASSGVGAASTSAAAASSTPPQTTPVTPIAKTPESTAPYYPTMNSTSLNSQSYSYEAFAPPAPVANPTQNVQLVEAYTVEQYMKSEENPSGIYSVDIPAANSHDEADTDTLQNSSSIDMPPPAIHKAEMHNVDIQDPPVPQSMPAEASQASQRVIKMQRLAKQFDIVFTVICLVAMIPFGILQMWLPLFICPAYPVYALLSYLKNKYIDETKSVAIRVLGAVCPIFVLYVWFIIVFATFGLWTVAIAYAIPFFLLFLLFFFYAMKRIKAPTSANLSASQS